MTKTIIKKYTAVSLKYIKQDFKSYLMALGHFVNTTSCQPTHKELCWVRRGSLATPLEVKGQELD